MNKYRKAYQESFKQKNAQLWELQRLVAKALEKPKRKRAAVKKVSQDIL